MYELYVIDKVKKGREAAEHGETISIEDLKKKYKRGSVDRYSKTKFKNDS